MSNQTQHVLELMEEMREAGRDFCAVTVVRTANATSAKAGAKAIVGDDGVLHGFVGGGCVQGAVKRAAALTHRLLAFSRRQTLDPMPTNVNRLISGLEDLVRRTVGPSHHGQ